MNKTKNTSSFDELYMLYHRMVYAISFSVLHSEEAAKDITQEVFIRLFEWRDRIKDENKIKGWLGVTAKNMSLNLLRTYHYEEELGEVSAKHSNPEEIYLIGEDKEIVHSAMSRLRESYVEVLTLRYALDFSVHEISVVTKVPSATVYTRLKRAKKALEAELIKVQKEAEK